METRRLGLTDIELTPIGLGCMQFTGGRSVAKYIVRDIGQDTVTTVVSTALDGGINWFDTAEMYGRGRSEQMLATALRGCGIAPGEVTVATKWPPLGRTAGDIGRSIGSRLRHLGGHPIGLYQIHMASGSLSSIPAQLRAMAKLHRDGKIRNVGVSNFSARQLELAHRVLADEGVTLAANQVRINLLHRHVERDGVLDTARRLGVTLIAYSPLEGGILTGRFHDDPTRARDLPPMRRVFGHGWLTAKGLARTAPLLAAMREMGRAHGVSRAQVALNWLITHYGDTVVAIPGASKPAQAAEAAGAMAFELDKADRDRLDELSRPLT
ncbi:aldo/keto reductase [Nonomuraea sp. SBT364]|uniref:aldo/keto reductase n=1 Tax=Nonomuraea sp. SBT364 TaxID=1580530 RepID=UPI00066A6890|nr:aldo/keto reductase [Nonomuraea sp. SBT364]